MPGPEALPRISIAAGETPVNEGTDLVFTLSRTGATDDTLTVSVAHLREAVDLRTRLAELIGVLDPLTPSADAIRWLKTARHACESLYDNRDIRRFAAIVSISSSQT